MCTGQLQNVTDLKTKIFFKKYCFCLWNSKVNNNLPFSGKTSCCYLLNTGPLTAKCAYKFEVIRFVTGKADLSAPT